MNYRLVASTLIVGLSSSILAFPLSADDGVNQKEKEHIKEINKYGGQFLADGYKASWAPDGKRIVFGTLFDGEDDMQGAGIAVQNVETGQVAFVVKSGKDPVWSQGGRLIAYVDGGYGVNESIWLVEPSGENRRKLVRGGFPSWGAEDKTVFFHDRNTSKLMSLVIKPLAKQSKPLITSPAWYPIVSADGKRAAYRLADLKGKIRIVDLEQGKVLHEYEAPGGRGFLGNWSPDGKYIGYGGYGHHDTPGMWFLDVETGKTIQAFKGYFTMPSWSRDGTKLAVDLRLNDKFRIWMLPTAAFNLDKAKAESEE